MKYRVFLYQLLSARGQVVIPEIELAATAWTDELAQMIIEQRLRRHGLPEGARLVVLRKEYELDEHSTERFCRHRALARALDPTLDEALNEAGIAA